MVARSLILVGLIAAAGVYASGSTGEEVAVPRESLVSLPSTIDGWHGRDAAPLADDVVAVLGVDDYISRHYARAGRPPVALYAGYYASQRQGDTIHSPQNCLPGAGWQPVSSDRVTIDAGGTPITVNRYMIQKGIDRQLVLYWYQGRGRVVADEYANKAWLMLDAARLRRTNGALVRLITPVVGSHDAAFEELAAFTSAVFPRLAAHLP
ncbi:MAG TPA: EpsI family protein [Vicinamibacterales bacterium]|jgi:EpsI family protein|nr:EpsI family protein [Vicinamibacterales bacterium]